MKRSTVWPALVMIGGLVLPQPALAQYYPPSALRPTAGAVVQRNMRGDAGRSQVGESGPGVAHDALVGAAVGAGVGLITAVVATTQPTVTDHSEDVLAYALFVSLGAGLGLAVGALVGIVRH